MGGFDIVLANPPYVRADAQYKHLSSTPDKQRQAISEWKVYRSELASSGIYQTLFEKWDLYIPFLERAFQILRSGGQMVFIISDAYNFAKYAQKSHLFFLSNATIDRIDFCTDIPLFNAGVTNTILHFSKRPAPQHHVPVRMCRWGVDAQEFVEHCEQLPSQEQSETGEQIFKLSSEPVPQVSCKTVRLGDICYISTGLRPWLSSALVGRATAFTTDDLVQDTPDRLHPKRWVESKDTAKWKVQRVRFLEWGTSRAPGQFESATFPEFYEAPEKLLTKDIAASNLAVAYDADGCLPSHTAYCCVPWHYLSGVRNRALAKTAKYEDQLKPGEERPRVLREEVEQISRRFDAKYLLAVMNSTFAKQWIASNPRSKLHVYPDDWKDLPIAEATREEQTQIVALVNQVLEECSRTSSSDADLASSKLAKLEADLDNAVAHLYNGSAS